MSSHRISVGNQERRRGKERKKLQHGPIVRAPRANRKGVNTKIVAMCSLLDTKNLKALPLAELKRLAADANLETGWQKIDATHRASLVKALASRAKEWKDFIDSVPPFAHLLIAGRSSLAEDERGLAAKKADRGEALHRLYNVLHRAMDAAVHMVPSGSGIHIGQGFVLTCAHCIDHDDDEDEDEEKDASESLNGNKRKGRAKPIVTARGVVSTGVCVAVDEGNDLALLRLPAVPEGLDMLALASDGSDVAGTPVLALGNPFDWDLEGPTGAQPRKNGFNPFWVSGGQIQGPIPFAKARDKGVGAQRHSCWTYWGHSGCPIIDGCGNILALHSSWDDSNGQRHGLPLSTIRAFLAKFDSSLLAAPRGDCSTDEPPPLAVRLKARSSEVGQKRTRSDTDTPHDASIR